MWLVLLQNFQLSFLFMHHLDREKCDKAIISWLRVKSVVCWWRQERDSLFIEISTQHDYMKHLFSWFLYFKVLDSKFMIVDFGRSTAYSYIFFPSFIFHRDITVTKKGIEECVEKKRCCVTSTCMQITSFRWLYMSLTRNIMNNVIGSCSLYTLWGGIAR